MNARTISLPDLAAERKRNTALSLSEGFAGAKHTGALAASIQPFAQKPGKGSGGDARRDPADDYKALGMVLPLYYRCRQLVLGIEKSGNRVPARTMSELKTLEKSVATEIRKLHPLLFQRFDDFQLDRFLRAMPFLRLSSGRWVFGSENLNAAWPKTEQKRSFLLMSGRVSLFADSNGIGENMEISVGAVFGERHFQLGDETVGDVVAAAAHCLEPCIVGILSSDVLEASYADRAFGNKRIAQTIRWAPALARATLPDGDPNKPKVDFDTMSYDEKNETFNKLASGPVKTGLVDFSKVSTLLHLQEGEEVLSDISLDESVLVVQHGSLEVKADVTLTERLDAKPPKKVRMRIHLEKAEKLAGDSIFDKLDPYCIVKLGEFKRFQTTVQWNVGPNPTFDHDGVLVYSGEEEIEFTVMDYDKFSADDLCGSLTMKVDDLYDGFRGKIELQRPKRSLGGAKDDDHMMEPAGKLFISVRWDYEKVNALMKPPKQRTWEDQVLFNLNKTEAWGHEKIMLGNIFTRTLEQATSQMPYDMKLTNFRVIAASQKGTREKVTVLKTAKKRFLDFIRRSGREKQFMQACRQQSLDKQSTVKQIARRLLEKWESEEQTELMRKGLMDKKPVEEAIDPSRFRVAYRGTKATIYIRNALNLPGEGWFDKLDPYAIVRFRGGKQEVKTSVLQDAGTDPEWNNEGTLVYNGEVALEVSVWDYDTYSADDLIATGIIQVEQFCNGFEGMVPLSAPGKGKKKTVKQALITIGILWDIPDQAGGSKKALQDQRLTLQN
mmetsp:Transcript_89990/g.160187  ORF Transcript_89990/g.160187 Transcript_89990/m.160187 type:complete len:780 (-) Transcript_89990:170-2509(-)|eukprot:CAMPEP_0197622264 /NCGR_PEP_ID=MMETSP1338-20131121/2626_1 /TAXON_ID=43686 ORGANISM="Pelagodinium beii, Strain RCC1491" /NCGR_SAMPLE_ID=MMETSP1338 /ASSEMBLY_ACC=CAM_ASM_000754 /LENGTH=779 /DNA_ID=CAMNT_0043191969 /DNA_START=18 /DNA_END=2357 /DNA_ORIENTATION=+